MRQLRYIKGTGKMEKILIEVWSSITLNKMMDCKVQQIVKIQLDRKIRGGKRV